MLYRTVQATHKKHFITVKGILSFVIPLLLLSFISFKVNAEIQLSLQPTPVIAGEPASLIITSTNGRASIDNLPTVKNLKWIQNKNVYSKNLMTVNGKTFEQTTYQFIVSKPGTFMLPSMEITVGNDRFYTNEKEIQVDKGELSNLEKYLFLRPDYLLKNKKNVYVGEEIPLKIDLYKSDSLSAVPAEYPQVKINNIVFDDFSKLNRESDKFAPYPYGTPKRITKDGVNCTKTTFFTSFRALGSGVLKGTVSLLCNIKLSQHSKSSTRQRGFSFPSSFNDSFFGNSSFFSNSLFNRGRTVSKLLSAELPELNILPLPALPTGVKYLGLVGDWKIKESLSSAKIKEGEPLTLSLKITGTGSLETLSVPELVIPGFTVYSPEIQKDEHSRLMPGSTSSVTINYVLIPVELGKTNIDVNFATFSPNKQKYETAVINENIEVIPGTHSTKSVVIGGTPSSKTFAAPSTPRSKVSHVILYLKKTPGNDVLIPLWRNNLSLVVLLLLLGPLLWIIIELIYFRKKRIVSNPTLQRRNNALKRKRSIIKKVTKANSERLPDVVQQEVIPYINDLKGYSPGTTADELFVKLKERNLAEYIKEVNTLSYMPILKEDSSVLKNKLVKVLKNVSAFVIVSFALFAFSNKLSAETSNISPINPGINQLITAYNNANFTKAEKICKENIQLNRPSANWVYNLGNCYYQNGDLANAMVSYEQALRLAPRDSDALENLNFIRRKLLLPEVYQGKTPIAILCSARDSFRPDEWMVIFAIAWFIVFISLIMKRFTPPKIWLTSICFAAAVSIISLFAAFSAEKALYNNESALVVKKSAKIYTLPSTESSMATFALAPGEQVKIEEKLNNWVRIRKGHAEGWVNQNSIRKIWPY